MVFHSLDLSNNNTDSQAAMAVSRASDFGANGLRFKPRTLRPLFGQNLENGSEKNQNL